MISKSMAAVLVVLLCATVSQAQSVLNETFDTPNYSAGALAGQIASNGQVWTGNMQVATTFGLTGQGAGSPSGYKEAILPLGTTINSGTWRFSGDLVLNATHFTTANYRRADTDVELVKLGLVTDNGGFFFFDTTSTWNVTGRHFIVAGNNGTDVDVHYDVDIDFDNGTGEVSWYKHSDPNAVSIFQIPATLNAGSFVDELFIFSLGTTDGHDNLRVVGSSGPPSGPPTDFSWDTNGSGDWTTAGNWSPARVPGDPGLANHLNHTATFGNAISSQRTVFTDTAVSVRAITFDNTNTYAVTGPGSVNLVQGTASGPPPTAITVNQGSHQFQAIVNLHNNTTVDVDSGATLVFNNALNLNSNTLTKSGDGDMAIRNDLITGGGMVSLQQGTVSGSGTIGGDVTNSGGTISPGNSAGLTTVVPEPNACILALLGSLGIAGYVLRC